MYTESTGNTAAYNQSNPTESIWDSGETSWDLSGNVEASLWDVTLQDYSGTSGNAIILAEQSCSTPLWVEQ